MKFPRRTFLHLAAGAAASAAPHVARAQTPNAPRRIGYLHPATIDPGSPVMTILQPAWRKLGYVEGETVLLRTAHGDITRLPGLVAELIGLKVDVLIVVGPQAVRVARAATAVTPILALDLETDPVKNGLIRSWARPGGNVSGLFLDQASLAGKWLELLRETEPALKRIALIWDPTTGSDQLDAAKAAARAIGIDTFVIEVRRSQDHEAALATVGAEPRTGVMLLGSPILVNPPNLFAEAALKFKLPNIAFFKPIAKSGGLISYGANLETYYPRVIILADEILKGAKVGDLSAEAPTHYELVINMKTAKAIGLTVPVTLQVTADEVIE